LRRRGGGGTLLRMTSRVLLARCSRYEEAAGAIERLLSGLGGMGAFVRPGQTVLVKPNLLTDARPEEAVTTHPEIIRAVVRSVRAAGASPWVGDSPANVTDLSQVWEKTGMAAVCREESVPLVNLEKAGSETFRDGGISFTIARPVLESDAVISVPKVKTHVLTGLTCSVKNLYGVIPGFQKTALHKRHPRIREFSEMLALLYGRVKPVLAVADGVVAMDGDGPSAGRPFPLGIVGISPDGVALDSVVCRLMGMDPARILHLAAAERRGFGAGYGGGISVEGDAEDLAPRPCRPPRTVPTERIPQWLIRCLAPVFWHRPDFGAACISCGKCVKACPANALRLEPGGRPVLDPPACIACCCCHEVCPARAIRMTSGPAFRLVNALRPRRAREGSFR